MNTTTVGHLALIARHWDDLTDALATPTAPTWPPAGLRHYLAALDQHDAHEVGSLRHLERSPEQIGETPAPVRLDVLDTMRAVQAGLVGTADVIAADVQRSPMPHAPRTWPAADRARRNQLADADAADPRRWRYTGTRTALDAVTWLAQRIADAGGPFQPLTIPQQQHIATVARGAAERVSRVLDIGSQARNLERPCPCGGRITIRGGAGHTPTAHCRACGATWTTDAVAA